MVRQVALLCSGGGRKRNIQEEVSLPSWPFIVVWYSECSSYYFLQETVKAGVSERKQRACELYTFFFFYVAVMTKGFFHLNGGM